MDSPLTFRGKMRRSSFLNREESSAALGTLPAQRPAFVLSGLTGAAIAAACWVGMGDRALAQTAPPPNPVLKIGIVQRFGDEPQDVLTLQPAEGDRLSLRFKTDDGQNRTVTTAAPVKVGVVMEPLPEPKVVEKVVLGNHRSFESAEDQANQWRSRGIEVELAQPRQWQVWAKRDTYKTPLVRRLLLKNLQAQGARTAFIDRQVQRQVPRAVLEVEGNRLMRDEVEILSSYGRVFVTEGELPPNAARNANVPNRRLYGGSLRLQPNAYGNYTLVNYVPTETYLRGVVPHEIGPSAPPTAVQAQAILARTYALRNLRRFAIDGYELCADTQCQVYKGLTGAVESADRAIAATRGQVLTYRNELIDALYSSTTGGITAPFSDVWNGPNRPYLRAVVDSVEGVWDLANRPLSNEVNLRAFLNLRQGFNEAGWDSFRWRKESTLENIAEGLRRYLQSQRHPFANLTRVESVQVVERSPAGRVQKLLIQSDRGPITLEKDEILRALYAPTSTLFYLEPVYAQVPIPQNSPSSALPQGGEAAETTPTPSVSKPSPIAAEPDSAESSPIKAAKPAEGTTSGSLEAQNRVPTMTVLRGYAFVGGGLGHAVGMSQTGAYRLGRLGWTAARILNFYYPGAQLVTLNENIVFWRDPSN
ncbi:MAG: SpoIID/LytB domain-containing protein [Cyanobacteriota bacterium]